MGFLLRKIDRQRGGDKEKEKWREREKESGKDR